DVFSTFEGDNVVLTQLVGKELLGAYAAEFGDMDQRETVSFALNTVAEVVQEKTRASTLWQKLIDSVTDREHTDILDRGNQLELLVDREEHLLETVARRLRKAQDSDDGSAAFKVLNSASDHLMHSGRAHMDSWVFARVAEAVDACEDPEAKEVLGMLCDLYVLDIVEHDKGWFLEHNRLTTERTKAATAARNRLCTKLAGRARTLVDAFAIPEFVFDIPMLTDGGVDDPVEAAAGVEGWTKRGLEQALARAVVRVVRAQGRGPATRPAGAGHPATASRTPAPAHTTGAGPASGSESSAAVPWPVVLPEAAVVTADGALPAPHTHPAAPIDAAATAADTILPGQGP